MAGRKKRASAKPVRKTSRRRPRVTTTTTTTTRVVRSNPRRRGNGYRVTASHGTQAARQRLAGLQAAYMRRLEARTRDRGAQARNQRRASQLSAAMGRAARELKRRELADDHRATEAARFTHRRRNPRRRRPARPGRTTSKRRPMAKKKRSAAQRRAFRKMLAGLRRHKARKNPGRKRRGRARRRKSTTVVVATNPRRKRRKHSRGGSVMAKSRRHRRRNPARRHHRRRNPHRRYRRHRNPGGGVVSMVKTTIAAAIPAMLAGAGMAFADAKVFGDKAMPVQVVGKLGLAVGLGYALRNRPRMACLVQGSILGNLAYQLVAQQAGGVVAPTKQDAAKKMAALVYADRRMAALVNTNGTLRTQPSLSGMGQGMGDGGTALPTMPIYDPVNLG